MSTETKIRKETKVIVKAVIEVKKTQPSEVKKAEPVEEVIETKKAEPDEPKFKIGDDVRWIDSPFTIVDINAKGALLKQRFSIGINLKDYVPLHEIRIDEE